MDLDVELDFFKLETRKCISSDLLSTDVTYILLFCCMLSAICIVWFIDVGIWSKESMKNIVKLVIYEWIYSIFVLNFATILNEFFEVWNARQRYFKKSSKCVNILFVKSEDNLQHNFILCSTSWLFHYLDLGYTTTRTQHYNNAYTIQCCILRLFWCWLL